MDMVAVDVSKEERLVVAERYRGTPAETRIRAAVGALDEGRELISLEDTLRRVPGGGSYSRVPTLALAPPWARTCHVTIRRDLSVRYWSWRMTWRGLRRWHLTLDRGVSVRPEDRRRRWRGATRAPQIPSVANVLPETLVLWEAEGWEMRLPRDPALVQPVAGGLYHAYFTWNLTPFERLVLSG